MTTQEGKKQKRAPILKKSNKSKDVVRPAAQYYRPVSRFILASRNEATVSGSDNTANLHVSAQLPKHVLKGSRGLRNTC